MIKKFIKILMLCLLMCTCVFTVHADGFDIDNLEYMHLLADESDGTAGIKREAFVEAVIKGFYPNENLTDEKVFSDTDSPYVYAAYEKGVVGGTKQDKFSPDECITFNQAIKILVNAIGLRVDGEYPYAYLNMAQDIDLLKTAEASERILTREEASKLIMLGLNMYKATYNEEGKVSYQHNKFIRELGYTVVKGEVKKVAKYTEPLWPESEVPYADGAPSVDAYIVEGENRPAVVFFPGGAYGWMSAIESAQIPEYLNSCGISVFLVNYRVKPNPCENISADGLKGLEFAKDNAEKYGINPDKIGIMGCSAGGHLAAYAANNADESIRPKFAILGYPVISMTDELTHILSRTNFFGTETPSKALIEKYSNEKNVKETNPQTFIFGALSDNAVDSQNAIAYANALMAKNVPCELHMYMSATHGFANGYLKNRVWEWQESCQNWLQEIGIID